MDEFNKALRAIVGDLIVNNLLLQTQLGEARKLIADLQNQVTAAASTKVQPHD